MKYPITMLFMSAAIMLQPAFAQDDHSIPAPDGQNYWGYGAMIAMLLVFVIVILVLSKTFNVLAKTILKLQAGAQKLSPDQDDGDAAGINKPTFLKPVNLIFTGIGFAVICLLVYFVHTSGTQGQNEGSATKNTQAIVASKDTAGTPSGDATEPDVKLSSDPTVIKAGLAVFNEKCSACHGAQGQGVVGPNLTDDYWLHGGKIGDVYKSITTGYPDKGMPAWSKVLSPGEVSEVANFIESLKGTNPPGAKAPQGVKAI